MSCINCRIPFRGRASETNATKKKRETPRGHEMRQGKKMDMLSCYQRCFFKKKSGSPLSPSPHLDKFITVKTKNVSYFVIVFVHAMPLYENEKKKGF